MWVGTIIEGARLVLGRGAIWSWLLVGLAAGCEPSGRTGDPPRRVADGELGGGVEQVAGRAESFRPFMEDAERFARLEGPVRLARMVGEGRREVERWVQGLASPEAWTLAFVGVRTGHTAFIAELRAADVVVERRGVLVVGGRVVDGSDGFWRFVAEYPGATPVQLAAAWLVLMQGSRQEPLGPWSRPAATAPVSRREGVLFSYRDGEVTRRVLLRIEREGRRVEVEE